MPNTIDRLVDGAIACHAMKHTARLMHPSQTVMSLFKEPQRAVAAIQQILDSDTAAAAILIDLSKAFERVNPHWILRLLGIRRAPQWIVAYARFVLFGRRVTHKVQGRLLPSRAILQGVDMGRSFSVYLFCLAMDPVFHYLNRIPGVISVQGYVDDTTIVGSAENASWLRTVSTCYAQLRSAGFVVDGHSCYRSCLNSCMKFAARSLTGDELLHYWPQVDGAPKYPTVTAALEQVLPAAPNFGVVAIGLTIHFDTWSSHGGVTTQRFITQTFLLQQLGLLGVCSMTETSCERFHNGEPLLDTRPTHDGDFVSCWILTRTLIHEDVPCACSESAEEEPANDFESNHSVAASPRPRASKRPAEGCHTDGRDSGAKGAAFSPPGLAVAWL